MLSLTEEPNHPNPEPPPCASGRARSAMNALRHGLTARVVVLPSEDMAAYTAFSAEIVASLDARTPIERQFAQTVADNQWRINRIRSIEDALLAMPQPVALAILSPAIPAANDSTDDSAPANPELQSALNAALAFREHSRSLANLSIYEQRLHRAIKEALRQLKELQKERRERRRIEMDNAIRLRKAQEMKGFDYDPAWDGFVFANAEIVSESRRRDRFRDAETAERARFNLDTYTNWYIPLVNLYENEAA